MPPDVERRVAAASMPFVDHRVYTIVPRRMGEFIEVFDRLAMPVLLQTLGHPLGFWTSHVGPLNQFVHLWGYESLAEYEARCARRDAHPQMAEYFKATVGMIQAQETRLIRRLDLPSMKAA